ncbi:LLM class F420-dependent oxidoreductase [Sphaerisporangium siamense]|uniref:Putative F420-dependent oxidoreductase n=1 Tax=Sphaerisporangium siamense TaxID=795645 RepID=A0A7W7DBU0_9ACTN|nr:LLM class F420-dependent oxidoreductase [Sphaerisporangium siamense]MBB4702756.1 putative F420-dependent oxidoreductase [Sphaerisporangium siamense]GII83489.1 LLM class F420-dependent oxidoreductase [Sphaerisporangium siamense]
MTTWPALGEVGVWRVAAQVTPALASSLEELGYGAIWLGGSPGGDLRKVDEVLAATSTLTVATGIVNIWNDDAAAIGAAYRRIAEAHPGRFLLGVGAGHREATAHYAKPYEALNAYLDGLDAAGVPVEGRALAALGPRVLRLSAARSAGAHPYLTTPEHTRQAREILGAGPLLAPEQKVVVSDDPREARAVARRAVAPYLGLANYAANLRRLGFGDEDLAGGGSDRLIEAVVALGDPSTIRQRVDAHLAAGADHVNIQLLTSSGQDPLDGYRALAEALLPS